ncbi:MAG: hypothetical protein PF693_10760 [Spirochaetia bacterium]|nr:hypothetical protein [Spirochaetia bacterium]
MQIKTEIFKFRQIIVGVTVSLSIFFSALQSSSIFEKLLYDVNKIEIDLLTLCETNSIDDSISMSRSHAENIIDIMEKGLFHFKMIFSESGYSVVNSFYYLIKNKLIQSTGYLVFSEIDYRVIERSVDQIKTFIKESSREQKRALSILFILLLFIIVIILYHPYLILSDFISYFHKVPSRAQKSIVIYNYLNPWLCDLLY